MDKKTRIIIIALAAVCLLSLAAIWLAARLGGGTIAVISVNGEEYRRIDLSRVKESYVIDIDTQFGCNTVLVEPGRISVSSASCPDKICVDHGAIGRDGLPIICMPNRLVISIEGSRVDA